MRIDDARSAGCLLKAAKLTIAPAYLCLSRDGNCFCLQVANTRLAPNLREVSKSLSFFLFFLLFFF